MSNLALAWDNLADAGTLTASSAIALAPITRLQNKHVARKWRANAASAYFVCDLGEALSPVTNDLDTIALIGIGGVTAPTLRFRVSSADSTGEAGDLYDSGALTDAWDANYLPVVDLLTTPVNGRYVRVDISDGSASYIEAGRLFIGLRETFAINFQPGWERTWNDSTVRTIGRSGLSFDDIRDSYRSLNLTLEFVAESERWEIVEAIDVALGIHGDMLVLVDPASASLGRDSIWGYIETADPVIEPLIMTEGPVFRRTYQIRERL